MKSRFLLVALMSACVSRPLMAQTQQVTFDFVGQVQTWVVPNNVTSVSVDARGAQGGGNGPSVPGGKGGRVQTTLAVTPNQTLFIYVGGKGGDAIGPNTAGSGGFNGGGTGAIDNVDANGPSAGGGGASDVRQGIDDLAERVVVAGGGGGSECCTDGAGGDGGGTTGMFGATSGGGSSPGGGGTQVDGGTGGGGCNGSGSSGSLGQGGMGGNGNRAGGGGGGGYYGGGGGGGCLFGSGGGGGSSFSAGSDTIHTQGFQTGDGQVIIIIQSPLQTLGEVAAARAKSLLNRPYFEGAKGFDYGSSPNHYVNADTISAGYAHCDGSPACVDGTQASHAPGIDCSGLILWSYNTAAGATTRYLDSNPIQYEGAAGQCSDSQSQMLNVSTLSDLRPGDLLCFQYHFPSEVNPALLGELSGHVAMYVGEGEVVEAYLPGTGVIASSLIPDAQGRTRATYDSQANWPICSSPDTGRCFDFLGYRRPNPKAQVGLSVASHSPISLGVTDPDGFTIDPQTSTVTEREVLREVPGQLYYVEDSNSDDTVIAPILKVGTYLIKVMTKPGASAADTYSLTVEGAGSTLSLAKDAPINTIPDSGYGVASTGSAISLFIPVAIDIKPGETPNSINPKSHGKIPVAILSSPTFDAVAQIDQTSLTFGHSGDEISLAFCNTEDVNSDGRLDLVCHFDTQNTAFVSGDTVGVLKGMTTGGIPVRGTDLVTIVPK
jgi:cell wall-associated NlpC family hydrolase